VTYLEPTTVAWLLLLLGLCALRRRRWVVAGIVVAGLVHWQPAANLFELPLTCWYSASAPRSEAPQAIVVLAGYVVVPEEPRADPEFGVETHRRLLKVVLLRRTWRPLPVYASGGKMGGRISYAAAMKDDLVRRGVPAEAVRVEEASANTYENAVNTAALLKADGVKSVVLVTSEYHLLRAELCFRMQGIQVYPVSADEKAEWGIETMNPGWPGERVVGRTLHEYVALVWYRLKGRL